MNLEKYLLHKPKSERVDFYYLDLLHELIFHILKYNKNTIPFNTFEKLCMSGYFPEWRWGQTVLNLLWFHKPNLYKKYREYEYIRNNTNITIFNTKDTRKIRKALIYIQKNWNK